MKKFSMCALLAVGVAVSSFAWADHHEGSEHGGWFDAEHCDVCKPLAQNPQLMMSTKWESHLLKNGMMMVASPPKEQMGKFREVCQKMDMAVEKIAEGEKPKGLCGFCEAMGGVMQAGATLEKVETEFGEVTLVTSDNPETVKKIHEVAKRSQEEMEKIAAMIKKAG